MALCNFNIRLHMLLSFFSVFQMFKALVEMIFLSSSGYLEIVVSVLHYLMFERDRGEKWGSF